MRPLDVEFGPLGQPKIYTSSLKPPGLNPKSQLYDCLLGNSAALGPSLEVASGNRKVCDKALEVFPPHRSLCISNSIFHQYTVYVASIQKACHSTLYAKP